METAGDRRARKAVLKLCVTLLAALALAAQAVPEGKLGFSVAAEAARAAVKPGEPLVLQLTFRNTSDQAFRLPDRITPAPYDYWYLKLQEATTRKTFTGFSTRPMGAAPQPGEIQPELLRAGEVKTATVAFPEFAFLEGDMDFQAARNVWFPQRQNGAFQLPAGTYNVSVIVRFRAYPNRPNLPQNIQDAQRALENDPVPLWKGGEIMSSPAQIKVSAEKPAYPLSEVRGAIPSKLPAKVELQVSPVLSYDLPKIQFSFKLNLLNRSMETLHISNPMEAISVRFTAPDSRIIEIPRRPAGSLFNPPQKQNTSPIVFRKAIQEGKEILTEPGSYQLMPGASVEIIFECEEVVGERILAALANSREKFVEVVFIMPLINLQDIPDSPVMRSESFRLTIPKP
jgi:hypothetical protein